MIFEPNYPEAVHKRESLTCLYDAPKLNLKKHYHIPVNDSVTPQEHPQQMAQLKPRLPLPENRPPETNIFVPHNPQRRFSYPIQPAPFEREIQSRKLHHKAYQPDKVGGLNLPNKESEDMRYHIPKIKVSNAPPTKLLEVITGQQEFQRKGWRKVKSLESEKGVFMPFDKVFGVGHVINATKPDSQKCHYQFKQQ
ncbi:Hypothetical_protein [Hexamita inflata]|uniref:Hypothetical_protein n=1 Tax=Hexamita inflata TaxID=28002 RepID=A0AA86V167_9EUKA|nr:Hypothetical protein HINF_LOCUS59852 [Hexamita inflata]